MSRRRTHRTILFDLDGVLTRADTFASIVRTRLRRHPLRAAAALPAVAALAATAPHGRLRGPLLRYLVQATLVGEDLQLLREELADTGRRFATDSNLRHDAGLAAARDHIAHGDTVIVVTATEHTLARAFLDASGLHNAGLIASRLDTGPLGPRLHPHNTGPSKLKALTAASIPHPWELLYTDSASDLPLARACDRVVLVDPSSRTARVIQRHCNSVAHWHPKAPNRRPRLKAM